MFLALQLDHAQSKLLFSVPTHKKSTYIVCIGLEVDTQSQSFLAEDRLTMSTSSVGLLLWLRVTELINLHLVTHLAVNVIATLTDHLCLGQLPHCLQANLGISDTACSDKFAVILIITHQEHKDRGKDRETVVC